jgi:hypothetical protein
MEQKEPENGQRNSAGTVTTEHPISREQERDGQNPGNLLGGMPGTDQRGSGTTAILQETERKTGTDKKPVIAHPAKEVDRKTELQGMSTKPSLDDPAQIRRRTERDLKDPDSDIPYAKTEGAVRDLVCSLLERQDRMNADLFLEFNSIQEDIGMLKAQVLKLKTMKTGYGSGSKKVTASVTARAGNIVGDGDLTVFLSDCHDRVPEQFWNTIERLDQRLAKLQNRGRS